MRILSLHEDFQSSAVETVPLNSPVSLTDGDLIVLSLVGSEEAAGQKAEGGTLLDPGIFDRVVVHSQRRADELMEALEVGKTVVVFPPTLLEWKINEGGTMRKKPAPFSGSVAFRPVFSHLEGENIEYIGPGSLQEFSDIVAGSLRFNAVLENFSGTPIMRVKDTNRVVAAYEQIGRGYVVFMPRPRSRAALSLSNDKRESNFLHGLISLIRGLPKVSVAQQALLPDWSETIQSVPENSLRKEIKSVISQISDLENQKSQMVDELKRKSEHKVLFACQGQALEDAVVETFRQIGFKAKPGPKGGADIIIEYGGRRAAIEVKGVSGTANKTHVRQLVEWVMEAAGDDDEDEPKGILVINTEWKKPLNERSNEPFPDNVKKFANKQELCLMTGWQLFVILDQVQQGKAVVEDIANKLFETIGPLKGFSGQSQYLRAK